MTIQGRISSPHSPSEVNEATPEMQPSARSKVNISIGERAGRVGVGILSAVTAIVLLFAATSAVAVVLEILLLAAGFDLVLTGLRGHCPLYQRIGYIPRSLRISQ